jgi:hypothetical protein
VLAGCDPTDPSNNGFSYWVENGATSAITVSWCDVRCEENMSVPQVVEPRSCILETVAAQSGQTGDLYALANGSGRPLGYVFIPSPRPGGSYRLDVARPTEAAAVRSTAESGSLCHGS